MRVAFLTAGILPVPALNGGAVEVLTDYLIDGFLECENCEVDVYTIKHKKLDKINKERLNIFQFSYNKIEYFICRCINYGFKLLKKDIVIFPYDIRVCRELKKHDYDYIIAENCLYLYRNAYKTYIKYKGDTKFIFHLHNILSDYRSRVAYKFVVDTAYKVIFVSNFLKNDSFKEKECSKSEILYNCINFDLFKKSKYLDIRKKINIDKNDIVYIFTGRIVPEKGILELIKAFNKLSNQYENVKLLIVGSRRFKIEKKDDYFKSLEEEVKNDKVIFTGYVDRNNIVDYLKASDVSVIPSRCEEAFGVVALEGMASKRAIIATESGGLCEPLSKDCAIFIKNDDEIVDSLYNAMLQLYKNKNLRDNLGKCGYKRVNSISDFSKDSYCNNFMKKINL